MTADLGVEDASEKCLKLSGQQGMVALQNSCATWCHGCGTEIPWFIGFESKYETAGFAVTGVSMDEQGWPFGRRHILETKLNDTVVMGNQESGKTCVAGAMPIAP